MKQNQEGPPKGLGSRNPESEANSRSGRLKSLASTELRRGCAPSDQTRGTPNVLPYYVPMMISYLCLPRPDSSSADTASQCCMKLISWRFSCRHLRLRDPLRRAF